MLALRVIEFQFNIACPLALADSDATISMAEDDDVELAGSNCVLNDIEFCAGTGPEYQEQEESGQLNNPKAAS